MKQILLKLVGEIEDLRANLGVIAASPSMRMSIADAQDAKTQSRQSNRQHYEALRKEIESL